MTNPVELKPSERYKEGWKVVRRFFHGNPKNAYRTPWQGQLITKGKKQSTISFDDPTKAVYFCPTKKEAKHLAESLRGFMEAGGEQCQMALAKVSLFGRQWRGFSDYTFRSFEWVGEHMWTSEFATVEEIIDL